MGVSARIWSSSCDGGREHRATAKVLPQGTCEANFCGVSGKDSCIRALFLHYFCIGVLLRFCELVAGHATRELRLWRTRDWTPVLEDALGGHTGWVRTLAVGNTFMVSAACNITKVWKLPGTSYARMTKSSTIKHLGDVLVTAMDDDCIYAATADGVLHMWTISQALKSLSVHSDYNGVSVQAFEGRIISLVLHNDVVISAGHGGHIRGWCKSTLQMKAEAVAAHNGAKLHALTSASIFLLSGGADKFVRVWDPETLIPVGAPVETHATGVRSLAATSTASILSSVQTMPPNEEQGSQLHGLDSTLSIMSGDAQGEVILWRFATR